MSGDFGNTRKLPSGNWQARYRGPDGRTHRGHTTFSTRGMARGWLVDEWRLIQLGDWTPPSTRDPNAADESPRFDEYAERIISQREKRNRKPIRPRTAEEYRRLLRGPLKPLTRLTLAEITPSVVANWHSKLPDAPTQNGHAYALLSSIMGDALSEELIDRNPCRLKGAGKPAPKRQGESLTASELVDYLHAVAPNRRAIIALTLFCSLRSSEVRALRRCDVTDDAAMIRVAQGVTRLDHGAEKARYVIAKPKTAAAIRTISVPPSIRPLVVEAMQAHDKAGRPADGLLFSAANGIDPLNDSVLYKAHKRAAKAIGRDTLTLHDLRRTGATLAAQSGATTKEIMRRLGHTQPSVAMIYQVADDARDRALAARMPAIEL